MCFCFEYSHAKVIPISPSPPPPHTSEIEIRTFSTNSNQSFHAKIKDEYNKYKANLGTLEKYLIEGRKLILSSNFWYKQKNIEREFMKITKEIKDKDNPYSEILMGKFLNLKYNYKKILVYLYNADKLTLSCELEDDEDVCAFFQIRRRIIRFSENTTIHIIPTEDSREDSRENTIENI